MFAYTRNINIALYCLAGSDLRASHPAVRQAGKEICKGGRLQIDKLMRSPRQLICIFNLKIHN